MSSISGESITQEEIGDHDDSCKKRSANRTAYKMVLEKCAAWECRPQEDTYSRRRIKRLSRQLASESRLKYGKREILRFSHTSYGNAHYMQSGFCTLP